MLPEAINSINSSYELYSHLQTKNIDSNQTPPRFAENKNFDKNFQGMFIYKPVYKNCTFRGSIFERPAGESSYFDVCRFYDCEFKNADFRYCDIEHSWFISEQKANVILNSNVSFGTFFNNNFIGTNIKGTPFREMIIDECIFKDCIFDSFGFERTIIKNTTFENIDMSKIVFRFCDFDNVKFKNVTIHILDLAKNFGLINELVTRGENIKIFYGQGNVVHLNEALSILPNLLGYYLAEKDYYYVINILAIEKQYDELQKVLPEAFSYVAHTKDFSALQDLCNLIVKLNVFNLNQRKDFYNIVTNKIKPNDLSNHQIRSYTYYLDNIKRILLENPNSFPTASITLYTDIVPEKIEDLTPLLVCIESNIRNLRANINPKIEISHHSPYEIIVRISEALPTLLIVCQMFYYAFGGVKTLKDIQSSRHEKTINKKRGKENSTKSNTKSNTKKEISLKFPGFEFHYSKECQSHVEEVEYLIS